VPEVIIDNRASEIVADIIATLEDATQAGVAIFAQVMAVNDVRQFIRTGDPLQPKPVVGIVEGTFEQQAADSDDIEGYCRLPVDILIRFNMQRHPGAGELVATTLMKQYAEIVRVALLQDRSRGGKTNLLRWAGGVINGTEVNGIARPLTTVANEAFFTIAVSAVCAWRKNWRDQTYQRLSGQGDNDLSDSVQFKVNLQVGGTITLRDPIQGDALLDKASASLVWDQIAEAGGQNMRHTVTGVEFFTLDETDGHNALVGVSLGWNAFSPTGIDPHVASLIVP
jgi:hypothetical protein